MLKDKLQSNGRWFIYEAAVIVLALCVFLRFPYRDLVFDVTYYGLAVSLTFGWIFIFFAIKAFDPKKATAELNERLFTDWKGCFAVSVALFAYLLYADETNKALVHIITFFLFDYLGYTFYNKAKGVLNEQV